LTESADAVRNVRPTLVKQRQSGIHQRTHAGEEHSKRSVVAKVERRHDQHRARGCENDGNDHD
jgi:hypothetical protein